MTCGSSLKRMMKLLNSSTVATFSSRSYPPVMPKTPLMPGFLNC